MKKIIAQICFALALCALAFSAHAATGSGVLSAPGLGVTTVTENLFSFSAIATANASTVKHGLQRVYDQTINKYDAGTGGWGTFDNLFRDPAIAGPFPPRATGDMLIGSGSYWDVLPVGTTGQFLQLGDDPGTIPVETTALIWGALTVRESNLSLTDITTANATSLKHGFMPKLSGNATDVFTGAGTQVAASSLFTAGVASDATSTTNNNKMAVFSNAAGTRIKAYDGTTGIDRIIVGSGGQAIDAIWSAVQTVNPGAFSFLDTGGAANCTGTNPKITTFSVPGVKKSVPGSRTADAVIVQPPTGFLDSGTDGKYMMFTAWVSADDVVKVSIWLSPVGAGSYDPASFDVGVTVLHYAN